jgi:hypothetical protein
MATTWLAVTVPELLYLIVLERMSTQPAQMSTGAVS